MPAIRRVTKWVLIRAGYFAYGLLLSLPDVALIHAERCMHNISCHDLYMACNEQQIDIEALVDTLANMNFNQVWDSMIQEVMKSYGVPPDMLKEPTK